MMKVVLLDGQSLVGHNFEIEKKIFAEHGIEFSVEECTSEAEVIEKSCGADGVMSVYSIVNRDVIDTLKNCKVLLRYGIGYDVIDVAAASDAGIAVCNLPTYCLQDVALHTIALILNALRKITVGDRSVRRGEWNNGFGGDSHRPNKLTIGFLGFGNIARYTAKYASSFEMTMIAFDPFLSDQIFEAANVKRVSFDELLASSDIISIHAPMTEQSKHIINKDTLAKMKDGVIIVNTSRGGLICFDDLVDAIQSGKVQSVNLDVVEREPLLDYDRRILQFENVTITPHTAYNSIEAVLEMHTTAAQSVCSVLFGKLPSNTVNLQQLNEI